MGPRITVIGSINMDLMTTVSTVPQQGETVLGEDFTMVPGGKGANQAAAAAKLGGDVHFIGRVGNDLYGHQLMEHMHQQGVSIDNLEPVTGFPTGIATVLLSEQDNRIIVVQGANQAVTPAIVEMHEKVIAESEIMLLQLEIPLESVHKAAELANKHSTKVILNPAPVQYLPETLLNYIDVLTPNKHEFDQLFTKTQKQQRKSQCVITKGKDGVLFTDNDEEINIEGYKVPVVDTTGAGDTFNGALAVAVSKGKSVSEACTFANAAAALSVQKLGAQAGMPNMKAVQHFISSNKQKKVIKD
ncbi:ribokinase [Alteribacillus sp. YIM 98480]|uniref:ribokinase n=1 Tax=Alteribacillus sp. YIM 98480 TaxID=2606599 RepID=UPI00131BE29B|nr:ribokinase [Alteribacillus sp. YIM 98480]